MHHRQEIRKAIQSGNYAVDTPKAELQEMFPDMAQWRVDRMGIENLSEDTQEYIKKEQLTEVFGEKSSVPAEDNSLLGLLEGGPRNLIDKAFGEKGISIPNKKTPPSRQQQWLKKTEKTFDKFIKKQGLKSGSYEAKALKELWVEAGSPSVEGFVIPGLLPQPFNVVQKFAQTILSRLGFISGAYHTSGDYPDSPDVIKASDIPILKEELMHGIQFREAYKGAGGESGMIYEGQRARKNLDKIFEDQFFNDAYQNRAIPRPNERYGTRGKPLQEVKSIKDFLGWIAENLTEGSLEGVATTYNNPLREKIADLYPYSAWYSPVEKMDQKYEWAWNEVGRTPYKEELKGKKTPLGILGTRPMYEFKEGVTDPSEIPKEFEAHRVMMPHYKKQLKAREKSLRLDDEKRNEQWHRYLKSIGYE